MIRLNDLEHTRVEEGSIRRFAIENDCNIVFGTDRTTFTCLYSCNEERDKDIERLDKVLYVNDMDEIISRWENSEKLEDCCDTAPIEYLTWDDLDFFNNHNFVVRSLSGVNYILSTMRTSDGINCVNLADSDTCCDILKLKGYAEQIQFFNELCLTLIEEI